MLRVGITGGIGSGKTALTDWLTTQGIVIVDADLAARSVVEPGQPALAEIAETFGEEFLLPDGQLNRAALRQRVFADESQRFISFLAAIIFHNHHLRFISRAFANAKQRVHAEFFHLFFAHNFHFQTRFCELFNFFGIAFWVQSV